MTGNIVNRGIALYNGMIIAPGIDGRLFALDAVTGKPVWKTRVAYPQQGYYITMAPRIAGGKVIIGVSGGDSGETRGFFDAYDANSGRRSWRFYTVPGDPSQPYENEAMRAAAKTWGGDFYTKGGGGAVWDGFAFDPDANLVYVGTGNAEPWVQKFRGAQNMDNLYTCSILAVNLTTGQFKWHFQTVPNDNWDFDSVQQLMLLDLRIEGRTRKVLAQASKNGFFYVIGQEPVPRGYGPVAPRPGPCSGDAPHGTHPSRLRIDGHAKVCPENWGAKPKIVSQDPYRNHKAEGCEQCAAVGRRPPAVLPATRSTAA